MSARLVPAAGFVAIVVLAACSVVQNLVLNPLATAPGRSLHQIQSDVAAAGESLDIPIVLGIAGLGVLLALALLVAGLRRRRPDPRSDAVGFLILGILAGPAHWLASFAPGIALADTYGTSGAAHSPWGWPIYLVSCGCLVALAGLLLIRRTAVATTR